MIDGDRFELKEGGGRMMLFGLPLFVAGVATLLLPVIPPEIYNSGSTPWYVLFPFAGVFAY